MKICVAQIQPQCCDVKKNIANHIFWVQKAIEWQADYMVFSEMSITGYEPKYVEKIALSETDSIWGSFRTLSTQNNITLNIGLPLQTPQGVEISQMIFQPQSQPLFYSKQILHPEEKPYFIEGTQNKYLTIGDKTLALAICYESLQKEFIEKIKLRNFQFLSVSVAKAQGGMAAASDFYEKLAKELAIFVIMANCVGTSDGVLRTGQSSVWNPNGKRVAVLSENQEGMLFFDTNTQQVKIFYR